MSTAGKAVFLSYASQDADPARRIADALRAAGVEVWFDQSELVGGDAWDAKIRKQIQSCTLFIPIISANTQARTEGYFRLEWRLADQRTHLMAKGRPFLLPIVIDETRDADAQVPDSFTEVQWTRLPGGEAAEKFSERVRKLLGGEPVGAASAAIGERGNVRIEAAAAPTKKSPRVWWFTGAAVAVAAIAIAYFGWLGRPSSPAEAPVSAARELARRAFEPLRLGTPSREQLETAQVLCDRALTLDPTDPELWIFAAKIDRRFIVMDFDTTTARRERAMSNVARAMGLAPDSFEARAIKATVLATVATTDAMLTDVEAQLVALHKERPDDRDVTSFLAVVTRKLGRFEASADYFEQIGSPGGAAWSAYYGENFARAEEAAERSLQKGRTPSMIALKAILAEVYREDVPAAREIFREIPASAMLEEGTAFNAVRFAFDDRRPDEVIEILSTLPTDYLSISGFRGPKALLTGRAHELAGRPEAARADWQVALRLVEKKLAEASNDPDLLRQKAELLASLGESAAAETALRLSMQLQGLPPDRITRDNAAILLRLGRREPVLAYLTETLRARGTGWRQIHAAARFDPTFDPLRDDPRFTALLRETLPPGAKPFDDAQGRPFAEQRSEAGGRKSDDPLTPSSLTPSSPPPADAKSVAVLAFANVSDDKANEYFSDGISEELLNVLAKVPGLKVTARTSAFFFKGKQVPMAEIAQQLGVAYVVEGSVRKAGDRVRITAQLIKAADGFNVWSDKFDRDLKDIFAVQDEIAGLIAQNLQLKLDVGPRRPAVSPEAYRLLLQARYLAQRENRDGRTRSIDYYRRAIAEEPGYALAWGELARVYAMLARYGDLPMVEGMREARTAAQRALELNPNEPSGFNALGWVQRLADLEWRGARSSFARAMELAPDDPTFLSDAAIIRFNTGREDDGIALARRAIERDPLSARAWSTLSDLLSNADRDEEALHAYSRAIELAPEMDAYRVFRAIVLCRLQRFAEADASLAGEPNEGYRLMAEAMNAKQRGDVAASVKARDELIAKYAGRMTGWIAMVYALEGENDQAFAWLERAAQEHDRLIPWVRNHFYLRNLHADPRWPVFLAKVGLTDEQLK